MLYYWGSPATYIFCRIALKVIKIRLNLLLVLTFQMRNWVTNTSSVDRTPPIAPSYAISIPRLFDYKSMVAESRRKYQQLPEVQRLRLELQRRSNYRTNQLMASVFRKRLKKRVLKGQVSMSHRNQVI